VADILLLGALISFWPVAREKCCGGGSDGYLAGYVTASVRCVWKSSIFTHFLTT